LRTPIEDLTEIATWVVLQVDAEAEADADAAAAEPAAAGAQPQHTFAMTTEGVTLVLIDDFQGRFMPLLRVALRRTTMQATATATCKSSMGELVRRVLRSLSKPVLNLRTLIETQLKSLLNHKGPVEIPVELCGQVYV
jgi:hypothetical protein